MILWNIILSIVTLLSILFSIYTFIKGKRNEKAITEIIAPELEQHKTQIIKIQKKL